MKRTAKDVAATLIKNGKITENHLQGYNRWVVLEAFGHKYRIDEPFGKSPKIYQLDLCQNTEKGDGFIHEN